MASNGSVGRSTRPTDVNTREAVPEAPRQKSTIIHYNSFPGYNTIQYETSNGWETTQHTAAGSKVRLRVLGPDLLRGLLMMLMAMDHLSIALKAWEHGTGRKSEEDGAVVENWNTNIAYIIRSLTHLCAPGFTLLLGMSVVYLGNSRKQQGWSMAKLARYFALRMTVLVLTMIAESVLLSGGQLWFLNMVLFALAVDLFLAGMLWILINRTEEMLTDFLLRALPDESSRCDRDQDSDSDAEQPLLHGGQPQARRREAKAESISWHLHNLLLIILSIITIFWNIWFSDDNGHCTLNNAEEEEAFISVVLAGKMTQKDNKYPWLTIWYKPTNATGVASPFPPLAWLSFAIVGILYGRIVICMPRTARKLMRHVGVALSFTLVFVLTRVLQFGNLSEDCLRTPENRAHPNVNQYLVSPKAFFYVVKYPPDVAFWAYSLAANYFLLGVMSEIPVSFAKRWLTILLDFGSTALFFYLVHLPVVFLVAIALTSLFGHDTGVSLPQPSALEEKGIDNIFAYFGIWMLCMLIMWPLCRWYGRFKSTKPSDSLWRVF